MDYDTLSSLASQGLSSAQIGKQLNCSQTQASRLLRRFGIKTKYTEWRGKSEKPCYKCKKILPLEEFHKKRGNNRTSYCKKCFSEDGVNRSRSYKIKSVEYKGGKCQVCGYNKCFGALEFHHIDPSEKDFSAANSSRSFESIKPELDKCILLCANCHRETHAGLISI